jgi:CubicO group peptidase (beta-lactamase class C family)
MKNIMRNIIIALILAFISGCYRDGPLLTDTPVDKISNMLDSLTPSLMNKYDVVGMSVAVIHEGDISISKSYGYADIESKRIVDGDTVFRAASLGKPILAYIVISLSQQGKINLDVPLCTYLSEDVVKGDPRSKLITARMSLAHTTGLPNLDGRKSAIKFLFDPGTDYQYSGHAYLYLQKVIEKITGKHLNELANELVFKPLLMTDSSFVWRNIYRERISSSYDDNGEAFRSSENPNMGYSAWSLFTTTTDYARFVAHMIDSSHVRGSVAAEMMKTQVEVASNLKWGLGWGLQETVPNFSFWHWGSMAGFRHFVVGYPQEKIAVVVMTNTKRAFRMVDDVMANSIGGSYPSYDWL